MVSVYRVKAGFGSGMWSRPQRASHPIKQSNNTIANKAKGIATSSDALIALVPCLAAPRLMRPPQREQKLAYSCWLWCQFRSAATLTGPNNNDPCQCGCHQQERSHPEHGGIAANVAVA